MLSNKQHSDALEALKARYPDSRSALLPALRIVEHEFGWLSDDALHTVSTSLGISMAMVRGVATFHEMFRNKPSGRHMIQLCTNVACMLFGADTLTDILRKRYNLIPGGTSPDGRFSLIIMECIGACDGPPAMLIDEDLHTSVTPETLMQILERYK